MSQPLAISALSRLPGVRGITPSQAAILAKRLPKLAAREAKDYSMFAVDPLETVKSAYPEAMRDEAHARAALLQEVDNLQYLEDAPNAGRWFEQGDVSSYEMPLLAYDREQVKPDVLGLFRWETGGGSPLPRASIQVGARAGNLLDVLLEEARHGIDRNIGQSAASRLNAPTAFAGLLSHYDSPAKAAQHLSYFGRKAEMDATLSDLLAAHARRTGNFVDTRRAAEDLLEYTFNNPGTYRNQATAEALLNSKPLRNKYIPYLLKALSAGGAMAGNELLEQGDGDGPAFDLR